MFFNKEGGLKSFSKKQSQRLKKCCKTIIQSQNKLSQIQSFANNFALGKTKKIFINCFNCDWL